MLNQRPLRNEVVEGQKDIANVEDDGVYLRHGEEGRGINLELRNSGIGELF